MPSKTSKRNRGSKGKRSEKQGATPPEPKGKGSEQSGEPVEPVSNETVRTVKFTLRGCTQFKNAEGVIVRRGDPLATFKEMLAIEDYDLQSEPLIEWARADIAHLAVVDVDYHGDYKPARHDLETAVSRLSPAPAL